MTLGEALLRLEELGEDRPQVLQMTGYMFAKHFFWQRIPFLNKVRCIPT